MRWEDGGIRPSLGGETLVTDSWDVNRVFVWGLMMDGGGGVLPPQIWIYVCDCRVNAIMRKHDELGLNRN